MKGICRLISALVVLISLFLNNMRDQILIDIDFDFFFSTEKTVLEAPFKEYWMHPSELFNQFTPQELHTIISHKEVLGIWDKSNIRNATCYHFDAHHDLWDLDNLIANIPLGTRTDLVSDSNFLIFALRENIIGNIVIVAPNWQNILYWHEILKEESVSPYTNRIEIVIYSEIVPRLEDIMSSATLVTCALSPMFTPNHYFEDFKFLTCSDQDMMDMAFSIQNDFLRSQKLQEPTSFFYNRELDIHETVCPLYHGSSVGDLNALVPSDGKLFASPSPAFAASFGLPLYSGEGWIYGVETVVEERPFVYLLVPEGMEHTLDAPMTLYTVVGNNHLFKSDGSVKGYEFSSDTTVPIAFFRHFTTTREALDAYGVKYFFKSTKPHLAIPQELITLYSNQIANRFEMEITDVTLLPFFEAHIAVFLIALKGYRPSDFPWVDPAVWVRLLNRSIMPVLDHFFCTELSSYHGQEHAFATALQALQLALRLDINPIPPMIAAALHDIGRTHDFDEEQHASDSAAIAQVIINDRFRSWITEADSELVVAAIRNHADGCTAKNLIEASLWDADRARLAWERGFERHYFSTFFGAECGQRGEQFTKNAFLMLMNYGVNELKVEITDKCNLTCTFCHKAEPDKDRSSTAGIDQITWTRILDSAEASGIMDLRVTGGEPLLHPDIDAFLSDAKSRGFIITINTNALLLTEKRIHSLKGLIDCFKISLPAPNSLEMETITRNKSSWGKKLNALGMLLGYGFEVEALTIMTRSNILLFDEFIELLSPLSRIRWVPLRAESNHIDKRPVSRNDIAILAQKIYQLKSGSDERWDNLLLGLAMPFCVLDEPIISPYVFRGRQDCSPITSISVNTTGQFMSCYSNREPLESSYGLHVIAKSSIHNNFDLLPSVCQECPYCIPCRAGCSSPLALEKTAFGVIDYLANPSMMTNLNK